MPKLEIIIIIDNDELFDMRLHHYIYISCQVTYVVRLSATGNMESSTTYCVVGLPATKLAQPPV